MSKLRLLSDIGCSGLSKTNEFVCDASYFGKQKHLPFPLHQKSSVLPFEHIHYDIGRPFSHLTAEGHRFFLTIVDDFSRVAWVYLMRSKAELACLIAIFYQFVFTQYQFPIRHVQSDNGVEFALDDFHTSKGILHQRSCVETHNRAGWWSVNISTF